MDVAAWLKRIVMLDELIQAKSAERLRIWEAACGTVGRMDGMPHAPGISDKVGGLAVKLAAADEAIERYERELSGMLGILERLPAAEYGVLHRKYVRGLSWEQAAEEMGYSTVQVWRIKKRAIRMLAEILEKERG